MAEQIQQFVARLSNESLTDEIMINEKLQKYLNCKDQQLLPLYNYHLLVGQYRLTATLKQHLTHSPKPTQMLRKKIYSFLADFINQHKLLITEHIKSLFSQLLSLFWQEQSRPKQYVIEALVAIIDNYDEEYLLTSASIDPKKLHGDLVTMLQTKNNPSGVVGQIWYFLSTIQSKFPTVISPSDKKKVQEMCLIDLKKNVDNDKNLGAITAILKGLTKSLKENYLGDELLSDLFYHLKALIMPIKSTYNVPLAALDLLENRKQLFSVQIMDNSTKLFDQLKENLHHKNRDFKLKNTQVFVSIIEEMIEGIIQNKVKHKKIFQYILNKTMEDLFDHDSSQPFPTDGKTNRAGLITIIRVLGILAPIFLEFRGMKEYRRLFSYLMQESKKKILKKQNTDIGYFKGSIGSKIYEKVFYAQKELISFIASLSRMIELLDDLSHDDCLGLHTIFMEGVREVQHVHMKFESALWNAMILFIMGMHSKTNIFSKWMKKVTVQAIRECLDTQKFDVISDDDYLKMVQKASHLWVSLLKQSTWRNLPLQQFSSILLTTFEEFIINLDCSYQTIFQKQNEKEQASDNEPIVHIFYLTSEFIQINNVQDHQFLNSLSLVFNEIILTLDQSLFLDHLTVFYPQILLKLRTYPKSIPLMKVLRTLNQFTIKTKWFSQPTNQNSSSIRQLQHQLKNFHIQLKQDIFKYQEQYFYEALKMLVSFPNEIYVTNDAEILKYHLPLLLKKTLELGQQIVTLADCALKCLTRLFQSHRVLAERHLTEVIPCLEKFISTDINWLKDQTRTTLFLSQQTTSRQQVNTSIMSFLGSLGGICHRLVDNKTKDHVSWDYQCKIELEILMLNQKHSISLTKLLSRVCWLAINGKDQIKVVACEFLHSNLTYVIGLAANNLMANKQNLSQFLDKIFPTILSVASNTSHPSQQLLHTLLIQTIHFFANTKQQNSPDIQTLLRHILSLYSHTEDMSYLASKCLSQFVKWHIKQLPENSDLPVIKAVIRNIWSLVSNKKAKVGIIHFLTKFLKIIHRDDKIMSYYALELGSLILSLARTNKIMEQPLKYLCEKYILSLKRHMKALLIELQVRKYKKIPTIHALLDWLYKNCFFSLQAQQRHIAFMIWQGVIRENKDVLGYDQLKFLKERRNLEYKYLFSNTSLIIVNPEVNLTKAVSKITAYADIWIKLIEHSVFEQRVLLLFRDLECIYIKSFTNFIDFLLQTYPTLQNEEKIMTEEMQHIVINCLMNFLRLLDRFQGEARQNYLECFLHLLQNQGNSTKQQFVNLLFRLLINPLACIPNFNYDLVLSQQSHEYIRLVIQLLQLIYPSHLYTKIILIIQRQFNRSIAKLFKMICQGSEVTEREARLIFTIITQAYHFEERKKITSYHHYDSLFQLMLQGLSNKELKNDRKTLLLDTICQFKTANIQSFLLNHLTTNSQLYQKYEKLFVNYVIQSWQSCSLELISTCLNTDSCQEIIKQLFAFIKKLEPHQLEIVENLLMEVFPKSKNNTQILKDSLKLNFILMEGKNHFSNQYLTYVQNIAQLGLRSTGSIEIHQEAIFLTALFLQKCDIDHSFIKFVKSCLNTLTNHYVPYSISKLKNSWEKQQAIRYFKAIRNLLIISQNFSLIQQFFITLKDDHLSENQASKINGYIEDTIRECFCTQNQSLKLEWAKQLIEYYWNEEIDKDEWSNYRLLIVERILKKIMKHLSVDQIVQLYKQNIQRLEAVLKKPLTTISAKTVILDLQIKKGSLCIVQGMYTYLPKPQKQKKQEKGKNEVEMHKMIINHCTLIVKKYIDDTASRLLRQHDAQVSNLQKGFKVYREYVCAAYNCLIVTFIATQSNPQHFKSFIFENNKQTLWDNLIDNSKQDFNFEVETEFKVMQDVHPIKSNFELKHKIKKEYFNSSLYVIPEEYAPQSSLPTIKEETEQLVEIINPNQKISENPVLEEDLINKHPCMVNLLRVIDYLHLAFNNPTPSWMKPIEQYLSHQNCKLAERIFLLKLVLNRPAIFWQSSWAKHLLNYLSLKNTGGKSIHYFYRDALKLFLKLALPNIQQETHDAGQIHIVLMKLIKSLPHENNYIYSDNIDLLEQILSFPNIYIDKIIISKMLQDSQKDDQNQWKMCAVIVLKLAIAHQVPVLAQEQAIYLKDSRVSLNKFKYYFQIHKNHFRNITGLINQSNKKYRIAGSGFLGQYLNFIFNSDLSANDKQEHFKIVSQFLASINKNQLNRNSKEKFTLSLYHVVQRFPQILSDQQLFAAVEDALIHTQATEREQILLSLTEYAKNVIKYSEMGKIYNIFMRLRTICQKIMHDSLEVKRSLLFFLNTCTHQLILLNKDIIFTYHIVIPFLQTLHQSPYSSLSEIYYQILIKVKNHIQDPDTPNLTFFANFVRHIYKCLIQGLGSTYQSVRDIIFSEFQRQNLKADKENIDIYNSILFDLYHPQYQELWLLNAVPLLISLAKNSSDYNRYFFQTKLEEKAMFYDWDFRNFKLSNASLPYTPAYTMPNKQNNNILSQMSVGGEKLKGMIKASQNSYLSQQQQIFTLLGSSSQSDNQSVESQQIYMEQDQSIEEKQEGNMSKINTIFVNHKKRNKLMNEASEQQQDARPSPAVKFVADKIRFNKKTTQISSKPSRLPTKTNKIKRGALLRTYKIGELPNIQISLQNMVEPMIYLSRHDHQFSSQIFVQIFDRICSLSLKNSNILKDSIIKLLMLSQNFQYNFISSLQKCLITLCQHHSKSFDLSLKSMALPSNTIHFAIIFTQQNIIQQLNHPQESHQLYQLKNQRIYKQWCDLADYYQHLNEDDLIFAIILKTAEGQDKEVLKQALELKKNGDILQCKKKIEKVLEQSNNERFSQFLEREKIDCAALLSEWDEIKGQITQKSKTSQLSTEDLKILLLSLQNSEQKERKDMIDLLNFKSEKHEYELALKYLMIQDSLDRSKYHSIAAMNAFKHEWRTTSSFAFNTKHYLLQSVQKIYELSQFIDLYRKQEVKEDECLQLFNEWSSRSPNEIYDNNLTWVQILSSRVQFGKMLAERWSIPAQCLAKSTTEWLIQVINGMLTRGVLGYAENITRKALQQHKLSKGFNWQFYESISKLKLLQLLKKGSLNNSDYQIVPKLIKKEMDNHNNNNPFSQMKLKFIENQYLQGYMESCLANPSTLDSPLFVDNLNQVYRNYDEIKRNYKHHQSDYNFHTFNKEIHFKFSLFLEKILSLIKGKFEIKEIKQQMTNKSNLSYERLAIIFVEQLILSIKLLNLNEGNYSLKYDESQQLFSLILKLLKIVQLEYKIIGKYFEEAINDKNIPKWIFLYFIPQIIRTLNSYDLSLYFKDLFQIIINSYPEALVYPFNCTYPRREDCKTEVAKRLFDELHAKMDGHFKFIDNLYLLSHPQLRLKDVLQKALIPGELENAQNELKETLEPNEFMGKYNIKFYNYWSKQIKNLLELIQKKNIKEFETQVKNCLTKLDTSKPELAQSMRYFSKLSDGSTFFEDYNSNDSNRIEVPGTSYCRFEEPHVWNRIYIQSFDHQLLTLNSIRKPKRITILGSNEKKYMLLVKGGQDVRLDQRIQELFDLINRVLKHNCETSQKMLEIKRFEVVPMKKMFGVFEWVDESQTLRSFLEAQLKEIKGNPNVNLSNQNDAFQDFIKFFNKICPNVHDKYVWHRTLLSHPSEAVIQNINRCEGRIPYGLLRFALQKLSKSYDSFLHIKNTFISNYAASCLVTYILGIGDRHLDNFLIQASTASIIMIDFGYSFGASIEVSIPELIPFRLTKTFRQLTEPTGFQGAFKRSMVSTFEALSKKFQLLVDYCDVFVDDPLMEWVWVSRKQLGSGVTHQLLNNNQTFSVTQQPPEKKIFSKRIEYVEKKLKGHNPRVLLENLLNQSRHKSSPYIDCLRQAIWSKSKNKSTILNSEELINQLISLATDKNITGRSYIGLNMYV